MACNQLVLMLEPKILVSWGTTINGMDVFQGKYDQLGDHNGKPLYQREVNGSIAMIYFAEVEQGPQGWRCGPDYNEFWVFCPADSPTPPSNGWFAKGGFNFKNVLAVSLGGLICPFIDDAGIPCLNPRPTFHPLCVHGLCKAHCRLREGWCERHKGQWQQEQDNTKRKDKANRSRGGKRSRGDREAYELK